MRTIREQILHRTSQPGGDSRSRIIGSLNPPRRAVGRTTLDELVESGQVIRARRPAAHKHGTPAEQYFTDPAEARKWEKSADLSPRPKPAKPKPSNFATLTDPSNRKTGAHWASLPSKSAPQPVVIPAGLKPKVLPSAPVYARHQLPPDAAVPSVVSSAECRPWVRALEGARP